MEIIIQYINAKGTANTFEGKLVAEFGDYFRLYTGDSPKTFRKDRVKRWLRGAELLDDINAHHHSDPTARDINKSHLPEICFTGFSKADKARLEKDAKAAGFYPTKRSITVKLLALCCGENAGPSKLNKAKEQGCLVLDENQFYKLIETGEIPEE